MSAPVLLRGFNSVAGRIAPGLPALLARNRLLRPHSHAPQSWELPAAQSARRVTFRFGLSGLRWGAEGPVTLMLHGWEGRPTQFRFLVEALLERGRQVIALEGPAHGESAGSESSLMGFALALQEAAVEIRNLESVVGHSMGAAAVAIALNNGLPAERAVLMAPPAEIEPGLYGFADALGLPAPAASRFVRMVEQANGVPASRLQIAELARAQRIPALVVHDRADSIVPFREGESIAKAWPGARLHESTGLGHWRVLTDAAVVREAAGFLAGPPELVKSASLLRAGTHG